MNLGNHEDTGMVLKFGTTIVAISSSANFGDWSPPRSAKSRAIEHSNADEVNLVRSKQRALGGNAGPTCRRGV